MSTTRAHTATPTMVDWDLAVSTANRLTRPGPQVSRENAREVVADLRAFALQAEGHVRDYTGLHAAASSAPVVVVDRRGWVQANADAFAEVLRPLAERMARKRAAENGAAGSGLASSVGPKVTGVEAGAVLAFLSSKVLGQFDPYWPADGGEVGGSQAGRLLLVAPNVVQVERELAVDRRDFRLWVCLHEETHRVQFTAVPWLRSYLRSEISAFLDEAELDASALVARLRESFEQVGEVIRGEGESSFIDLVQTPKQREVLDRLTAVMSLLEGHADVVMDGVGPEVVPTVATIRERFQQRRRGGSWGDQLLKRLLGLDAKLRQYRDGAKFVRHVVERVDQAGFNEVWAGPQNLPTKAEIADPDLWLRRILSS